ncbi:5-hydroxytryptamine receptor 1D [Nematostella vectensis]|uniref:5-hydroxytryptamine receptor 1D n=1 Tax=Nematostella vectensis TaxID=45351 RepID=UPI00138FA769|nr:5-hydroxytryptamine receptor 1D [Nematostella vectensis]
MLLENASYHDTRNATDFSSLDSLSLFEAASAIIVITFSVTLNITVSAVIMRNKHLRKRTTNIFIVNLSVSNSFIALFIIPLSYRGVVHRNCTYGNVFCTVNGMLCITLLVASVATLCCISVDRYFAVVRPMKYKNNFTVKRALLMLLVTWLLAMFCGSLPLTGWTEYSYHPITMSCSPNWQTQCGYYVFMLVVGFGIPMAVLVLTYGLIFSAIRKHDRRVSTWSATLPKATLGIPLSTGSRKRKISVANSMFESSTCTVAEINFPALRDRTASLFPEPSPCASRRNTGHFLEIPKVKKQSATLQLRALTQISAKLRSRAVIPREYKIAKTGLMLFLVFFLSWGPYFMVNNCGSGGYVTPRWLYRLAMWMVFLSCPVNPLVYAYSSKHIRDAFKRGLKCKKNTATIGVVTRRMSNDASSIVCA